MSCISRIEVIIMDLDAFKQACEDLDLAFMEGQKEYHTDDGQRTCEHAVRVGNGKIHQATAKKMGRLSPVAHELGLVRARYDENKKRIVADQAAEGWTIMVDTYGRGSRVMIDRVGKKCETLMHSYGCHAVRNKATQMNWSLTEQEQEDGSVVFDAAPRAMLQEEAAGSW